VLRDGSGFGGADGDMAAEGELPVKADSEPAERWLLAFLLSSGDWLNGERVVHHNGWGGVVLLPCDVYRFKLFGGKGDFVFLAPLEHVPHVLGDQLGVFVEGVGSPV
jgi:hypothetical protein